MEELLCIVLVVQDGILDVTIYRYLCALWKQVPTFNLVDENDNAAIHIGASNATLLRLILERGGHQNRQVQFRWHNSIAHGCYERKC